LANDITPFVYFTLAYYIKPFVNCTLANDITPFVYRTLHSALQEITVCIMGKLYILQEFL